MKICAKCKHKKSSKEFGIAKENKDGSKKVCKICTNEKQQKERRLTKRIPTITKEQARETKLRRYQITSKQYQKLFDNQNSCCAICRKHQSELRQRLCVDHNHKNGIIRGLLCPKCNMAVGIYEEQNLIKEVENYLKSVPQRMTKFYRKWLKEI